MRKQLSLALTVGAMLLANTAQAALIWFNPAVATDPAPASLGPYTMTPFGDDARPVFSPVSDAASPLGGVIGFSTLVSLREVGSGWDTWSHGYTGDVYFAIDVTSLRLTLPEGTAAFYFFAEPNDYNLYSITAVAGGSDTTQIVDGRGGAAFFGVFSDDFTAIDYIDITIPEDAGGLAVGEFGIAALPEASAVPEPSTLLLLGAGLLATRMRPRKA